MIVFVKFGDGFIVEGNFKLFKFLKVIIEKYIRLWFVDVVNVVYV